MGLLEEIFAPTDVPALSTVERRSATAAVGAPMDVPYIQPSPAACRLFEARCLVEREYARPSARWLQRRAARPAVSSMVMDPGTDTELLANLHMLRALPACSRPEVAAEAALGAAGVLATVAKLSAPPSRRRDRDDSEGAAMLFHGVGTALQTSSEVRVGLVPRGDLGRVDRAYSAALRAAAVEQASRRSLQERAAVAFGAVERARAVLDEENGILKAKLAAYGHS